MGASLLLLKEIISAEKAYTQSKEVKVFNYSYYIDPRVNGWFEELTGIKVIYDEYESGEEALAKLEVGGGGYDVIILPSEYLSPVISKGLVRVLDKDMIPNTKYIDETYVGNPHDPGLDHSVPYLGGTTGLGVNVVKVEEKVDSWNYVFEDLSFLEKYKKKISMLEEFTDVYGAALFYLGLDPSNKENWKRPEIADRVAEVLIKQKPYLAGYYGASIYIPQLISERLLIAHAWSGDVEMARNENPNIRYVIPREGALKWNDFAVIPKGATNINEAYQWINFITDPLISAINSVYTYYISPITSKAFENAINEAWSRGLIDVPPENVLNNPAINPPEHIKNLLKYYPPITEDILQIMEDTRKKVLGMGYRHALIAGSLGVALAAGIGGYLVLSRRKGKEETAPQV